jgi:hypothetical protein
VSQQQTNQMHRRHSNRPNTRFSYSSLFGNGRQIWLPLFLAISLELGALFGPALLLRRR